jgi:hypothetical protein
MAMTAARSSCSLRFFAPAVASSDQTNLQL